MRLALYTFGVFRRSADDPANETFSQLNAPLFALSEASAGFLERSGHAGEPGPASWGPERYPRFYEERGDGWSPATLSLWASMEAALAYIHHGPHAEAMRRGAEWFVPPRWPPYVAWWADARPTWAEGAAKLEALADHGARPDAFSFREAFDPAGRPYRVDGREVTVLARRNAAAAEGNAKAAPAVATS